MHWPQTGATIYHDLLKYNQRVKYLLFSMAKIYDIWDGSLEKRKVRGLGPCCSQDGYRAQVQQRPIDIKSNIYYFNIMNYT